MRYTCPVVDSKQKELLNDSRVLFDVESTYIPTLVRIGMINVTRALLMFRASGCLARKRQATDLLDDGFEEGTRVVLLHFTESDELGKQVRSARVDLIILYSA